MEQRRTPKQRIDPLVVTGILTVLGLIVLVLAYSVPLFRGFAFLQVVGGVLLGAGVSAWIGTATGREAIHQQSAREANLRRKTDTYGPLYAELKALRTTFTQAKAGEAPAPLGVDTGAEVELEGTIVLPNLTRMPALKLWREFQAGYHDTDFSLATQQLLDTLQERATGYSNAVAAARESAISILTFHADTAIHILHQSKDYKHWQQQQAALKASAAPTGQQPKTAHAWYGYIETFGATSSAIGRTPGWRLAHMWLTRWPDATLQLSRALGWLLSGHPDKAAGYVHSNYPPAGMEYPPPPLEWIQTIFEDARDGLQQDQAFRDAVTSGESLFQSAQAAETTLETGLRRIQEQYEGGEPLV